MAVPTDQEILDAAKTALFEILSGAQSYTLPNGRTVTKADIGMIEEIIAKYEERVASQSGSGIGGGTVLIRFKDAV